MSSKKESSPSHRSTRRNSLPEFSELSSPKSPKPNDKITTKSGSSDIDIIKAVSQENLETAIEILEKLEKLRFIKESKQQLPVRKQKKKTRRNSAARSSEAIQAILKKSFVAEVHETRTSYEEATDIYDNDTNLKTESKELVVALPKEEKDDPRRTSIENKTNAETAAKSKRQQIRQKITDTATLATCKLLAASKLVRSSDLLESDTIFTRSVNLPSSAASHYPKVPTIPGVPVSHQYINPIFQPYPLLSEQGPPSPAPPEPYQKRQPNAYFNPLFEFDFSTPIESSFQREPCIADFLYQRANTISEFRPSRTDPTRDYSFDSSQGTYIPIETYELPNIFSINESPRRRFRHIAEQGDTSYPVSLPYIQTPPNRSVLLAPGQSGVLLDDEYRVIRTPEPEHGQYGEDSCTLNKTERVRYHYQSPRNFLNLSPEFDEDYTGAELHQLPQERFFRARSPSPRPRRNSLPSSRYPPAASSRHPMGRMNPLEDQERKIIIEFCHLLEKSKQLFNGLRELPQYGHKQWHSYFGRTFDVYTKLWKFQQQHRAILDSKYGLKRWQIGEIASKIGQLYYHFYLRTSETAYLNEAYSFYFAIRGRSYYTQACKEDKCELMVKKLRYYARFIVACLLLKKGKLVKDLIKELDKQIIEYGNAYEPDDQNEWRIVADEVRAFIKAEPVVAVIHPDDYVVILSHRLSAQSTPPVERSPLMNLSLQEVLIVGSNSAQVKFSELTMDMFRMMQTLEREPTADVQHMYDESPRQRYISTPSAVNNKGYSLDCSSNNRGESPHKYLLFKPSPNQIFVYLASACDDLPPNGAVLLYISAEGLTVPPMKHPEDAGGYDVGGLITTSKTDIVYRETTKEGKPIVPKHKELQVLHPGDLYPFTRRPMFLIIDSDNSFIFHDLPRFFGQPLVILMSPLEQPSSLHPTTGDKRAEGSLFTLFLHCPLSAFCFCCDIKTMPLSHWERAQNYIDTYLAEASQLLTRSRIDGMYMAFMGDDFLRLLILRFIFCETFLRMHRLFRGRTQRTRASPPLPEDLYEHPSLIHIVIDLASHLQVRGHFHDPSAVALPQPSNRE